MEQVATCPTGCIDEGDTGGLFCLGPKGGLRFHAGFQCPGFNKGEQEYACGPAGASLLRCEKGVLVEVSDRECSQCYQAQATGSVTCKDKDGALIQVETGAALPALIPAEAPEAAVPAVPSPPPSPKTNNAQPVR